LKITERNWSHVFHAGLGAESDIACEVKDMISLLLIVSDAQDIAWVL